MIHELPAPIRGATHADVYEVVFNTRVPALILRAELGVVDANGVFKADAVLAPIQRTLQETEYETATVNSGMLAAFGSSVLSAIDAAGWTL